MPHLHRVVDDSAPSCYPLQRVSIELQGPASATLDDMLCDLNEIDSRAQTRLLHMYAWRDGIDPSTFEQTRLSYNLII